MDTPPIAQTPPTSPSPTIDRLLNLVPDSPATVLSLLQNHPSLSHQRDHHGYSLLHAAASYGHIPLLRTLVQEYGVDVNITDEDNETPLFAAESVAVATCLVEELGADITWRNDEGWTARERIEEEAEFVLVASYLKGREGGDAVSASGWRADGAEEGSPSRLPDPSVTSPTGVNGGGEVRAPPRIPSKDIKINLGTMEELPPESEPDPEVRRKIEELAARDDFESEEGQKELRKLVESVVGDLSRGGEAGEGGDVTRRRVE